MVKEWFEVSVKYLKNEEEKEVTNVNEVFLFDAVSWIDAETKANEEFERFAKSGFTIKKIVKKKLTDVLAFEEGEFWFECGVEMVVLNEGDTKEKKTKLNYLVMADDIIQANYRVFESLEDSVSDFKVVSLSESNIYEVFPYIEKEVDFSLEVIEDNILKELENEL